MYVPQKKLEELSELLCCAELAESDKVKDNQVFRFQSKTKLFICSGLRFLQHNITELSLYRVIFLADYKGKLKPLLRGDHWQEVDLKRRHRSYTGRMIIWKKMKMVICEEVKLLPLPGTENIGVEQLNLFVL